MVQNQESALSGDLTIVVFGGTGDLTKRKLVPTFSALLKNGAISKNSIVLGIGKKDLTDESYKQFLIDCTSKNEEKRQLSGAKIFYLKNSSNGSSVPKNIDSFLKKIEPKEGNHRIYYLAINPGLIKQTIKDLREMNLNKSKSVKLVLEKPIGVNLESSMEIEEEANKSFKQEEIYRLDHYLGKEVIQNIHYLKLTNPLFERLLSRKLVQSIEIILDEDLGVSDRIDFYNQSGAVKDIIQNHLIQTLSLILMDLPYNLTTERIREEKIRVLRQLQVLPPKNHLLGQYSEYGSEAKRANINDTKTETFAKIALNCKSQRWDGTKITIRTGKKLEKKYAQIIINLKPLSDFFEHYLTGIRNNKIIINIQPTEEIKISLNTKSFGESSSEITNLDIVSGPNSLRPTEGHIRLMEDVIKGDQTLFVSREESEAAWKIVEEIEKIRDQIKFVLYNSFSDPENENNL